MTHRPDLTEQGTACKPRTGHDRHTDGRKEPTMNTHSNELQQIIDEQGWTDETVGELALQFIDYAGHGSAFLDYCARVQATENAGE